MRSTYMCPLVIWEKSLCLNRIYIYLVRNFYLFQCLLVLPSSLIFLLSIEIIHFVSLQTSLFFFLIDYLF